MNKRFRLPGALGFCLALLASTAAVAQTNGPFPNDRFQRYFKFHNSFPATTIYPVIEAPLDANCDAGQKGLIRIMVNKDVEGAGVPPGATVLVALPKKSGDPDVKCPNGAFYGASRIYMFTAPVEAIEQLLTDAQKTRKLAGWDYAQYLPCTGCYVGMAGTNGTPQELGGAYGYDVPAQLLEYTIISQNSTGSAFADPNNPDGTPVIDFDVSYVDYANTPFAMGLDDGGAAPFMGSTLGFDAFNGRLTQFITDPAAKWSRFAAYAPQNWATPSECPTPGGRPTNPSKTSFSCLATTRSDVAPSSTILLAVATSGGGTDFYKPVWDGRSPKACNTRATNPLATENLQCAAPQSQGGDNLLTGNCCPTDPNPSNPASTVLGCCDLGNFQIDNTFRRYHPETKSSRFTNDTVQSLVQRFDAWQGPRNPCSDPNGTAIQQAPVLDKPGFCAAFKKTIDFVWNTFVQQCAARKSGLDRCTVTRIIGYDLKSGYNPNQCKQCPNDDPAVCPAACTFETQLNQSVQALQRGLPWTPAGDPALCSASCPGPDCPNSCVFPQVPSPKATLYHRDKFLHFWADPKSVYSLNPYAWFVHNMDRGLAAPGAYSFSIDDFYGNFGGVGSGLIIEAGGYSQMRNQEPYDPFKEYYANLGGGWHHMTVCERRFDLAPGAPPNAGLTARLSFWNEGTRRDECIVRAFPSADESVYVEFKVTEVAYDVKDAYTGRTHRVQGLSGAYAPRFGESTPLNPHCREASKAPPELIASACSANMSQGFLEKDYVGVGNDACVGKGDDATCGKPLVSLNMPGLVK